MHENTEFTAETPGFRDYLVVAFKGAHNHYALPCVSMGKQPRENSCIFVNL